MSVRSVGVVMEPKVAPEAEGVLIRRTIGSERLVLLDPFLLLDHLTVPPVDGEPQELGFPRHPHRGIETLTYVLTGAVHHKDSCGNDSRVEAPGTQWMTAGGGIFHEEYFTAGPKGCEAVQIWFNLPAIQKMKPASYHPAQPSDIPEIALEGGATVRVIAGTLAGTTGPLQGIAVEPLYLDVYLPAGATVMLPAPAGQTTFAYVVRGNATFGEGAGAKTATVARLVIFCDGDSVQVSAPINTEIDAEIDAEIDTEIDTEEAGTRFLFVSAPPLREPVLQYRSLVMNTIEEMKQALDDLEQGTFAR